MERITQPMRYRVDMRSGHISASMHYTLDIVEGDKNANSLIAELYEGDVPFAVGEAQVSGRFVRPPDEAEVPMEGEGMGNEARVIFGPHCYTETGDFRASIILTMGETRRTILTVSGRVLRKGSGVYIDVENVVPNVDDIIAQYAEMKRVTQEAIDATEAAKDETEVVKGIRTAAEAALEDAREATEATDGWYRAGAEITMLAAEEAASISVETNATGAKIVKFQIPRGFTGLTPQITFQIATGEPGTNATIAQSGTAENPVLLLTIPRGDTGDVGNLKINGVGLSPDGTITLTADDIGALDASRIADNLTTDKKNYALSARAGAQLQKEKQPMIDKSNAAAVRGLLGLGAETAKLGIQFGGTGATTKQGARKSLELGNLATRDIQSGTANITAYSGFMEYKEITFNKPFKTTPIVMVSMRGNDPINDRCSVSDISPTGCTLYYGNQDNFGEPKTGTVAWMAIGYLADETEG